MTQEEKAKVYDEALERAKKELGTCGSQDCDAARQIFRLFPELNKESEDEKVRKALIEMVHDTTGDSLWIDYNVHKSEAIAWLEKQCNTPKEVTCTQEVEVGNGNIKALVTEKIPIDKVEPKFKVGDWVIDKQGIVHQIANVIENVTCHTYSYDIVGGGYFNDNTEGVRLWTIQDAKDGDVLASELCDSIIIFSGIKDDNIDFYCDYDFSKIDIPGDRFTVNNGQHYGNVEDSKDFHPATKEQRELLFSKMKEAGYEWDTENKQLKKISQRMVSAEAKEAMYSNPAWSEEDERSKNAAIQACKGMIDYFENSTKQYEDAIDWLESLKQRVAVDLGDPKGDIGVKTVWDSSNLLEISRHGNSHIEDDLEEAAKNHKSAIHIVSPQWTSEVEKAFIAGAEWQKEKACEWLKENKDHPLIGCEDPCLSGYLTDEFIEDFKQAMNK